MSTEDTKKMSRPVMLYDGDCAFCRYWVGRWSGVTGRVIEYHPYQKALSDYPQVTEESCRSAVQLIMPDGAVFPAAHGVFKAMALSGRYKAWLWSYEHVPFFGGICEAVYSLISHNRPLLSKWFRITS